MQARPCLASSPAALLKENLPCTSASTWTTSPYFLDSNKVERAFEQALSVELQVDFMGDVASFLVKSYDWQRTDDDQLTVLITQTAKIESMLEDFDLVDCNAVRSPY
jgi:hypothetical protein